MFSFKAQAGREFSSIFSKRIGIHPVWLRFESGRLISRKVTFLMLRLLINSVENLSYKKRADIIFSPCHSKTVHRNNCSIGQI